MIRIHKGIRHLPFVVLFRTTCLCYNTNRRLCLGNIHIEMLILNNVIILIITFPFSTSRPIELTLKSPEMSNYAADKIVLSSSSSVLIMMVVIVIATIVARDTMMIATSRMVGTASTMMMMSIATAAAVTRTS